MKTTTTNQTTEHLTACMKITTNTYTFIIFYANHETLCKSMQILNTYANLSKYVQVFENYRTI